MWLRYLSEHGFAVLGDEGSLIAVERYHLLRVEHLLGMLQYDLHVRDAPLEYTPEITGYKSPSYSYQRGCGCRGGLES